jgi:hypothetical protein
VIAVRKVNELDFYSLGLRDLARNLRKSETRLLWLIQHDGMQANPEFYKEIKIGRSRYKRYSGKCQAALTTRLAEIDLDEIYAKRNAIKTD